MSMKRTFAYYLSTMVLCMIAMTIVLQLWRMNINVPLVYSGDANMAGLFIKNIIENGWYLAGGSLGGQFGFSSYDFPMAENLHFVMIKIISLFTSSYGAVLNIFYLLSFFLSAFCALYVLLKHGFKSFLSIVFSVLFAFLPYHFYRSEAHLFLSSYFAIPLVSSMLLSVLEQKPVHELQKIKNIKNSPSLDPFNIITCIIVSSIGVYYAFFTCFFLVFAFINRLISDKSNQRKVSFHSLIYVVVIIVGVLINVLPNLLYFMNEGRNTIAGIRYSVESEYYSLKIINLILPISGHRIELFAKIADGYLTHAILVNENSFAALGMIASFGFVVSISSILFSNAIKGHENIKNIGSLNLAAVLLATIGGLGTVFSFYISPMIRAYNRISIFMGFFSLFVVLVILEQAIASSKKRNLGIILPMSISILLLCFGLYDQTSPNFIPNYDQNYSEFYNDDRFIKKIESTLESLATSNTKERIDNPLVFQLPYLSFPESPPINKLNDYDPLRGYLHSKKLTWSYGAMKGREGDSWMREISSLPVENMITELKTNGYSGIYIDRAGYLNDESALLENSIMAITGTESIISDNARLVFIPIF